MPKVIGISIAAVCLLMCDSPCVLGQLHVARLQYLSRSGAAVGEKLELSVHGERMEEVDSLNFSHPRIKATVNTTDPLPFSEQPQPQYGSFTVEIPKDVPPGRYEVYARGRHGVTNTRAFLVSKIPNLVGASISHDRNVPATLPGNQLLHAVSAANTIDWFAFELAEGKPLVIELIAQQLDSAMIGQLKLYDSNGQTVVAPRGVDDLDPVLKRDDLPAGKYLLAVHDFMYRGGPEFHYQLLMRAAESDRALTARTVDVPGQLPANWSVRASTLPDISVASAKENDGLPRTIEFPTDLAAWFGAGQTDHIYQFAAKKGQQLAIDVVSQRVNEPTDARLIIHRIEPQATGQPILHQVAHIDDSANVSDGIVNLASKDPDTLFSVPEDSSYQLSLRDLDIGTSLRPRQRYRLRIATPDPGFDLVACRVYPTNDAGASRPFASKLFRGGAEMLRVFALRRGAWSGPIKINIEGLPDGVSCADAVIDASQNRTQMTLVANDQATGRTDTLRVIGKSEDGAISAQAVPVTISHPKSHGRNAIRTRVSTQLPVYISEQDVSPLSLTLGDGSIPEVKKGAALSLPIRIVRREGGNTPCVFRPKDFPRGLGAGEVTIAADATDGKIELKPNGDTKPGTYSIWLQAETKIKIRPNPQALERAQAYRMKLQGLHDDPAQAADLEAIKAAIVEADKRVEAAKGAANQQQLTVFIPTNHATIRVVQP